jgi:thiamine-monophosphate kinase
MRTELGTLGEFGLIERIKANQATKQQKSTLRGIGDDCAVIEKSRSEVTLISTDILLEGIHFDLGYTPLQHLGYKAVAVNVSDVAAMNGIPQQITVSIAISNRFSVEAIDELYSGIKLACENYKVDLVGGDTTSSQRGLMISVTVLGTAKKTEVAYRSGAKVNDVICVSGDLGAAYAGLQTLEREKAVFSSNPDMQPELEGKDYVIKRLLKPEGRTDIVHELKDLGIIPTSMIDISDGLASEMLHICNASGVGAYVFEDKLPISHQTEQTLFDFKLDPTTAAMNGGEDYELLFTVSMADFEKLKNHEDITTIGYITEAKNGVIMISKKGNQYPIKAQGWNHLNGE